MPLSETRLQQLQKCAAAIRGLSLDMIETAKSGHPGLPLGCGEIGAYLFGDFLNYDPSHPTWEERDRFILSAGHGSAWLYSCLHLTGYALTIEDLKAFRQLHSKTPGHPEYRVTPGVETTTGPLGQGLAHAVGMALGAKMAQQKHKVVCLVGDGCLMEGISHECCSLAGHWKLDNLIVLYDSNAVCLDGPTDETFTEDVPARFKAQGWEVVHCNGNDLASIDTAVAPLRHGQTKPTLVVAKTTIGYGSPLAGSHKVHGAPLGPENTARTKKAVGAPETPFTVPDGVYHWMRPTMYGMGKTGIPLATPPLTALLEDMTFEGPMATRKASQKVLQTIAGHWPAFVGGSADLSCSDMLRLSDAPPISPQTNWQGQDIKYGVREFAMASISIGLALTGKYQPVCATFLTFSDYMRNAIRLAALMRLRIFFQFTHDSILLGEDGPTHQPIEHIASLRAIPNLNVFRPADPYETARCWIAALHEQGPSAMILSRQTLPIFSNTNGPWAKTVGKGCYTIYTETLPLQFHILATGSEVERACQLAARVEQSGRGCRVSSVPCVERLPTGHYPRQEKVTLIAMEAGSTMGWDRIVRDNGFVIGIDRFGESAPSAQIVEHFGWTIERLYNTYFT